MALLVGLVLIAALTNVPERVEAWGGDGHAIVCEIAKSFLSNSSADGVARLLPKSANGNLSSECSWADEVKHTEGYAWSYPLHFIDTPDQACNYDYKRDCFGDSKPNFCAAGAINNYTAQLAGTSGGSYNLTEALLFLAHIVGDIHQPLHCGFLGDLAGNYVSVKWFTQSTNLHSVWDTSIITTTYEDYFNNEAADLTAAIVRNITTVWSSEAATWSTCPNGSPPCTDTYAMESLTMACTEAYANVNGEVTNGTTLAGPYFDSRYPSVEKRLAMGGVRLGAILNTIFSGKENGNEGTSGASRQGEVVAVFSFFLLCVAWVQSVASIC